MRIKRTAPPLPEPPNYPPADLSLLNPVIGKYRATKGNLIPLLQGTQDIYGFLPLEAFSKISSETGLELSELYGVATFYAQFRLTPPGKYLIKMCHGTACHVQQVTEITDTLLDHLEIKDGQTTPDGLFTLETVACLGCCSLAPVMMIGEETHGKLNSREALKIIKEISRSNAGSTSNVPV